MKRARLASAAHVKAVRSCAKLTSGGIRQFDAELIAVLDKVPARARRRRTD